MTRCPKCSSTRVSGPRYEEEYNVMVYEYLRYSCNRCGYSEREPCHDRKEPKE